MAPKGCMLDRMFCKLGPGGGRVHWRGEDLTGMAARRPEIGSDRSSAPAGSTISCRSLARDRRPRPRRHTLPAESWLPALSTRRTAAHPSCWGADPTGRRGGEMRKRRGMWACGHPTWRRPQDAHRAAPRVTSAEDWIKVNREIEIAYNEAFFYLLMALVGNLVSYLRAKSESESVTPDTAFRFNSKDLYERDHLIMLPRDQI
jgi:hypothetical protein